MPKRARTEAIDPGASAALISQGPSSPPAYPYSCALCRKRKVKCDKRSPCSYCVKRNVACTPSPDLDRPGSRPRRKRFPEAELLARIRNYESLLSQHGIRFEPRRSSNGSGGPPTFESSKATNPCLDHPSAKPSSSADTPLSSTSPNLETEDDEDDENEPSPAPASRSDPQLLADPQASSSLPVAASEIQLEFENTQRLILEHPDQDQGGPSSILNYYDRQFKQDGSSLLFSQLNQTDAGLASLHPSPLEALRLWRFYLERVHPIVKLVHAPTAYSLIVQVSSDARASPAHHHALLFAIYSLALLSISQEECTTGLGLDRVAALSRFRSATQSALHRAQFLRSSEISSLQALVLHLYSIKQSIDPRTMCCFVAIAERIARRGLLHRNVRNPPRLGRFEVEVRRRIWWEIEHLNARVGQKSGAGSVCQSSDWDVPLPSSRSDEDLMKGGDEAEGGRRVSLASGSPSTIVDESILFVLRCEVASFLRRLRASQGLMLGWSEFSNHRIPAQERLSWIQELETHLEANYLSKCDPDVPIQRLSLLWSQDVLSRMRVAVHVSLRSPIQNPTNGHLGRNTVEEDDAIFENCILSLEAFDQLTSATELERFRWFIYMNMPFLSVLRLCTLLRKWPTSRLADRAWSTIVKMLEVWYLQPWDQREPSDVSSSGSVGESKDSCATEADGGGGGGGGGSGKGKENATEKGAKHSPIVSHLVIKAWEERERALPAKLQVRPLAISIMMENVASRSTAMSTDAALMTDRDPTSEPPPTADGSDLSFDIDWDRWIDSFEIGFDSNNLLGSSPAPGDGGGVPW